jgi:hypothetical protein
MTQQAEGGAPPSPADGGEGRAGATAEEVLGPLLLSLIESVRLTAQRVIGSGAPEAGAAQEGDEAVHDFRVALRRLRTLLRPARWIYGKKRVRRIADGLRAFAATTGELRDQEVLRETLGALALGDDVRAAVEAWLARRASL